MAGLTGIVVADDDANPDYDVGSEAAATLLPDGRLRTTASGGGGAGGDSEITAPLGDRPEAEAVSTVDVNLRDALLDDSPATVQVVDESEVPLQYISPLSLFNAKGQNALVADTAELIVAANSNRIGLSLCNIHATIACYLGDSNAVTVANGYPLAPAGVTVTAPAGSTLRLTDYAGPIWAIATGGTPTIAFLEW